MEQSSLVLQTTEYRLKTNLQGWQPWDATIFVHNDRGKDHSRSNFWPSTYSHTAWATAIKISTAICVAGESFGGVDGTLNDKGNVT